MSLQPEGGTHLADLNLEKLTQTPPEEVTLPSVQQQQKKLKGWSFGIVNFFSEILEDVTPMGTGVLVWNRLQSPESEAESEDEETISNRYRMVRARWLEAARLAQGGAPVAARSPEAEEKPVEGP